MPEVSLPPFQIEYQNRTLSFKDVYTELGSGIIVVPLVGVLANVAIAKAFSKYSNQFRLPALPYQHSLSAWMMEKKT